jgi:hypothetical protein
MLPQIGLIDTVTGGLSSVRSFDHRKALSEVTSQEKRLATKGFVLVLLMIYLELQAAGGQALLPHQSVSSLPSLPAWLDCSVHLFEGLTPLIGSMQLSILNGMSFLDLEGWLLFQLCL